MTRFQTECFLVVAPEEASIQVRSTLAGASVMPCASVCPPDVLQTTTEEHFCSGQNNEGSVQRQSGGRGGGGGGIFNGSTNITLILPVSVMLKTLRFSSLIAVPDIAGVRRTLQTSNARATSLPSPHPHPHPHPTPQRSSEAEMCSLCSFVIKKRNTLAQ